MKLMRHNECMNFADSRLSGGHFTRAGGFFWPGGGGVVTRPPAPTTPGSPSACMACWRAACWRPGDFAAAIRGARPAMIRFRWLLILILILISLQLG